MEPLKMNNGRSIPVIGLGTWNSPPGEVGAAVKKALEIGYRHLDCAYFYRNEAEIGEALENALKSLRLKREDIFITSKLWNTFFRPEHVRKACEETLKDLRLNYLDLYLVHWPVPLKYGGDLFPKDSNGQLCLDNILGSESVDLLTEPWVLEIAHRHKKTPAQVLLRYLLQRKLIVVPKSVTFKRIEENFQNVWTSGVSIQGRVLEN
ncbi:Aldo-keto reductase family 1 member B10 [Schistosoma japonicum]|nr:Aldo-keto reductase family 1 member B10 [Schistosoma japonicum]